MGGEEHKLHAAFRQGITDHCQLCERIHHFHYCTPTEYQRSIGKDICATSFREAPCSYSFRCCFDVRKKRFYITMRLPQQIMSLAKAVRKPYLAGSIICICVFLLELTAWPNMSPWSWLYLAPYCIALLLLTWFHVPASMAILVAHIASAIIPAI